MALGGTPPPHCLKGPQSRPTALNDAHAIDTTALCLLRDGAGRPVDRIVLCGASHFFTLGGRIPPIANDATARTNHTRTETLLDRSTHTTHRGPAAQRKRSRQQRGHREQQRGVRDRSKKVRVCVISKLGRLLLLFVCYVGSTGQEENAQAIGSISRSIGRSIDWACSCHGRGHGSGVGMSGCAAAGEEGLCVWELVRASSD
jgi:hypothetical protein